MELGFSVSWGQNMVEGNIWKDARELIKWFMQALARVQSLELYKVWQLHLPLISGDSRAMHDFLGRDSVCFLLPGP